MNTGATQQPETPNDSGVGARAELMPALGTDRSRRDVVRAGVKLAFVAPVLSTFFARDAYAASYSCYPPLHACGGAGQEPCCSGACNLGQCPP